jgi:hypothetical protein
MYGYETCQLLSVELTGRVVCVLQMSAGEREEEGQQLKPPVFELEPKEQQVEEGETAKFIVRVSGYPRPRVTWWLNGTIITPVRSLFYYIFNTAMSMSSDMLSCIQEPSHVKNLTTISNVLLG